MSPVILHAAGGASGTTSIAVMAFILIFILSFAFGHLPEAGGKISRILMLNWAKVFLPRLALAGVFSGVIFLVSAQLGHGGAGPADGPASIPPGAGGAEEQGGGEACERAVLGAGPLVLTGRDFARMDEAMERMIRLSDDGDVSGALSTFLREVHDFTHLIDPPLRSSNAALSDRLYFAVAEVETAAVEDTTPEDLASRAETVRGLLSEAATALGCER